ncbi:GNAT family N-acetyltransferase [Leifsonia sp. A12D58]|uniref:GNAT family N-acetyltransferase n=1 Tax=Leifsonia sp. A12D58 TaxID=3397674 RepID=UPI0039E0390D
MTTSPKSFCVLAAGEEHRPLLEQLWTMFRHDMSTFTGALPDNNGRFRQERLDAGLTEPGWAVYLFWLGSSPVGLAVVRGLDTDERIMSSFFIVHGARRSGVGRAAVRHITSLQPGTWSVAFQDSNTVASRFWSTVAAEADGHWTLEHREVPGRPALPADAWVHFRVR